MSYTVTVKVELVGIPHTWITLTDENGNSVSYGYAGDDSNGDFPWPIDFGKVYKDDGTSQEKAGDENAILEGNGWLERYEITPEQYQSMVGRAEQIKSDPGTYLGAGNNCVDFVRDIFRTGNVPHPLGIGPHPTSLIPVRQRHETLGNLENMVWLDNFLDGGLSVEEFEELYNTAASTPISPIILDLDGDGVETIGVKTGAYFDHGGDGFAEQTGWAGADDGILVWDRNADGRINDGKELFGSETILADGTKAANGYQALSELDTNADGKIDSNDAVFANLKVWKDLDGDGYSSTGELFVLADVGVQSINTGATSSTYVDPAGNQHKLTGTFTKTDGTTGNTADVWFQTDTLYTIQEEYLTVPADIAALPDLRGYGNVYDLQQAMVRDTTGTLKTLVQNFAAETNPGNRNQLLEQILFKWTGADAIDPASRGIDFNAQKLVVMEKFFGQNYVGSDGSSNPGCNIGPLLDAPYNGLFGLVYVQLMAQTHLKSLYDLITYSWDTTTQSIRGDLSWAASTLQWQLATDPEAGRLTLSEFTRSVKGLQAETTLGFPAFRNDLAAINPDWGLIIDAAGVHTFLGTTTADTLAGTSGNDYLHGGAGNDTLTDSGGRNVIDAGDGDDAIDVGGDNTIHAGDGNDGITLDRHGYDEVYCGVGDDAVSVAQWFDGYDAGYFDQVSRIIGGLGNDYLHGSTGADTYVFNRGDGADTVWDESVNARGWNFYNDPDAIEFGAGIATTDVQTRRNGDDLLLTILDPANPAAGDRITVKNWFASTLYRIESLRFADGTVWDTNDVHAFVTTGTEGADVLDGWLNEPLTFRGLGGNDTINAQSGNDTIYGGDGNDAITDAGGDNVIDGDAGDDTITLNGSGGNNVRGGTGADRISAYYASWNTLAGGEGDDVLEVRRHWEGYDTGYYGFANTFIGGAGNDRLLGVSGYDTYIFNRGDGQDSIFDDGTNPRGWNQYTDPDRIEFGAGITASDLVAERWNDHLRIRVTDLNNPASADQITIENWFTNDLYRIETFAFADGATLGISDIHTLFTTGTEGADVLDGWLNEPLTFRGLGGNDTINAQSGNDTIYGGDGNDVITDTWGVNVVDAGSGDDIIDVGGDNTVYAGDGNDRITVDRHGHDVVYGGAGDDTVSVAQWSDGYDAGYFDETTRIVGGLGNDYLHGSTGADTYVFNRGDGADTVWDESVNARGWNFYNDPDTIEFGAGIATTDVQARRNGDDLLLTILDPANPLANDQITVENWFVSTLYRIETFAFADGSSLSSTQIEDLINYAPVLAIPLANYVVPEDSAIAIVIPSGTFNDPDNDVLTYSATLSDGSSLPLWLAFDAATGTFSGTPTNNDVGILNIRINASDPADLGISADFSLTVTNVNDAPTVASAIADQSAIEDAGFNFTPPAGTFADIDVGDSLRYTATLTDGSALPAWLSFDAATHTFSGTPGNGDVGAYAIAVTATDSTGASVEDVFALTVGNVNDAPVTVAPLADLSVNEDTSFSLSVAGTFADDDAIHGDALTYQATLADGSMLPSWLVFDANTQTLSGTPGNGEVGTYGIRITAADLVGLTVSDEFLLSIANINDAPVAASPIPDGLATEDSPFSYTVPVSTFVDVDAGDVLVYTASLDDGSALPGWLAFDPLARTFAGTPTNNDVGSLTVRVTATDSGGASVSDVFTLSVANVNDAPVTANTIASQVATEDSAWSFQVPANAFTDVDVGDTLALSVSRSDGSALPAWLVFDPLTGTFTGIPGNADVGELAVRVTATDASGAAISQVFTLTVANTNDGPVVANPVPDQSATEGSAFSYTVSANAFADIDVGDTLSYSAALADGSALPAWLTFNSATRTFSGTPTNGYSGVYDVRIIATDTAGLSVSDVFSLTVADTLSNVFTGTSSSDVLNGTVGADILQGLGGNDTLYGYAGNDTLDGGNGSDTMIGGLGNDTYTVNAVGDVVTESANEGTDTVQSSNTYTLSANVENLVLTGTGKINGTGNNLDNILTGNSANNILTGDAGNDTLDGGTGSDTLRGGTEDDIYVVNSAGDVVTENANEGTDTVQASITYTLGNNVENLTLTGAVAVDGTGNALNNVLTGNAANNTLAGSGGNDSLSGGAGNDALNGGAGNDVYMFGRNDGQDVISDNDSTVGNSDTANIGVDRLDIVFARSGNDLTMSLHGGTDSLTVQSWYLGTSYQTEVIRASGASTLLNTQVEQLIQAMATFSVQNGGISWDQAIDQRPEDVQAILAANWMPAS